jgi:thymidylate synthase ThyX
MISVKVIADSAIGVQAFQGKVLRNRLTTFALRYPRMIHSEFMTHRVFSRSASSSRAIPIQKVIQDIIDNPAMPLEWGSNRAGMQPGEQIEDIEGAKARWLKARDSAIDQALELQKLGLAKQIVNRVLEPFSHIDVLVTSTQWANWYALRTDNRAQAEIRILAETMFQAHVKSKPEALDVGQWHLPYVDKSTDKNEDLTRCKISAAKCCRVSYSNHEGLSPTLEEDLALFGRLMEDKLKHASPTEHQAQVPSPKEYFPESNLRGWLQFRKTIRGENISLAVVDNQVWDDNYFWLENE